MKCADCGQNMIRRSTTMRNGTKVYYYHCSTHKSNGSCSSHNINAEKIESLVLDAIKQHFFVLIKAQDILEKIQQQPSDDIRLKIVDKQLVKLKSDIEYYNNLKVKVYRDYVDNTISKDDYLNLNSRFQEAKERYEKALSTLEEKQKRLLTGQVDLQTWIDEIAQYRDVSSLNRNMVVSLIDSVQVFENGSVQVNFICDYDPIIHCGKRAYTDFLCIVVMDQIKVMVETMCDQKMIAEKLLNGEDKDYYCLSEEKKIIALEKKKYDCENAIERLYLDLTDEVIDAEDYKMLLTHYSAEKEKATSEIKQHKAALLKKKKVLERYDEILTHFSSAIESQTIDESLVDELIERITVNDGNRFEIDFKVKDEMEEALKIIGDSAL